LFHFRETKQHPEDIMFKKIAISSALACAAAALFVQVASADEQFDVTGGKGEVTVQAKGHWHVNKDYPWKAVVGDKTFDKSKFSFTETSAKLSGVPQGKAQLKGAVCDGPQCMPFTKEVQIN
jgi:hypothetical protein